MGKNLTPKHHRLLLNFTQKELADKLGIHVNSYSNKERGDIDFTFTEMIDLANIFGVNVNEILPVYNK